MSFWQSFSSGRVLAEPSLWSADVAHFANEITRMVSHADLYHINASNGYFAPLLRAAGDDTIVMGSLVFGSLDLLGTMQWLHQLPMLTGR